MTVPSKQPKMTAGTKHDRGKPSFNLIPAKPMRQLAEVYTHGAAQYGSRNWEKHCVGLGLRCPPAPSVGLLGRSEPGPREWA